MQPNDDFLSAPELDYDGYIAALREIFGCFSYARGTNIFAGRVRPRRVLGFAAVDLACDTVRVDRTKLDIRRDDMDYYFVGAQLTGGSTIIQNDRVVNAAAGELVLLNSTRPVTLVRGPASAMAWLAVAAPEPGVASRLRAARWHVRSRAGAGGTILSQLALDPVGNVEPAVASADDYMRLVVYDLLGALFAPPAPLGLRHTDKLFARVCDIIKNRFADPNISPTEVAAEMGISLRYLQKLFTARGSTCSHYISSLRLDHAARLIERRASMKTGQPLGDIAYACGFRDYTYFSRGFRQRFGSTPGAVGAGDAGNDKARVRADNGRVKSKSPTKRRDSRTRTPQSAR